MMYRLLGVLIAVALIGAMYFFSSGSGGRQRDLRRRGPPDGGTGLRCAERRDGRNRRRWPAAVHSRLPQQVRQHPNDNRVQLDAPRMTYIASDGHAVARARPLRTDSRGRRAASSCSATCT